MDYKNKLIYSLPFVFVLIFLIIVHKGLIVAQPGDENVYYYMAKLAAEGKIPYKDFFYAHPPLHIYILALIYGIFGFNVVILKLVPLISCLVTAFFIYKIARAKFGANEALAAMVLFLFSYSVMFNSVFSFGIMTATMFLVIGYYCFAVKNSYLAAGIFFGLAGITRLLSLIPIAVFLFLSFLSNKKSFLKLSSSFLAVFFSVNIIFLIIAGSSYVDFAYKYHLLKGSGAKENFTEYFGIIKLNWLLFLSAVLYIFAKKDKAINVLAAISAAYLLSLLLLKKLFGFYFIIVFPFLAVIGAYSIINVYKSLKFGRKTKLTIASALLLIFLWNLGSDASFLWKIGFRGFERGNDLAEFISLNSGEKTVLFGDESITPLLALTANKRIAYDLADTNTEVFASGLINLKPILNKLKNEDTLFIIRSRQGISAFPEVVGFLNENCQFLSRFHDKKEGDYLFYKC